MDHGRQSINIGQNGNSHIKIVAFANAAMYIVFLAI